MPCGFGVVPVSAILSATFKGQFTFEYIYFWITSLFDEIFRACGQVSDIICIMLRWSFYILYT